MVPFTRVNAVSFLLNLSDGVSRHAIQPLFQMIQNILACVFKPTRLFTQVMPESQPTFDRGSEHHAQLKHRIGCPGHDWRRQGLEAKLTQHGRDASVTRHEWNRHIVQGLRRQRLLQMTLNF